jgi:surfactin synthase thioesterase subunit
MSNSKVNLFLLPYAGGTGASFKSFVAGLPSWVRPIPVTLPGRGVRFRDPALTDWPELVDQLANELIGDARQPYALFGHSLGALVALELAHRFRSLGCHDLVWLGVSACVAPACRERGEDWLACEENVFLDKLRTLGGTPAELLENRELLDLYLPALRADFHLASTYAALSRDPLGARMLILAGEDDADVVSPPNNLTVWAQETTGVHRTSLHPGGHFFINNQAPQIARICSDDIGAALMLDEVAHG